MPTFPLGQEFGLEDRKTNAEKLVVSKEVGPARYPCPRAARTTPGATTSPQSQARVIQPASS